MNENIFIKNLTPFFSLSREWKEIPEKVFFYCIEDGGKRLEGAIFFSTARWLRKS